MRTWVRLAATAEQIANVDIDVGPVGVGLPAGIRISGRGTSLYAKRCAQCHGPKGEGMLPAYPALVGRDPNGEKFVFASDAKSLTAVKMPYADRFVRDDRRGGRELKSCSSAEQLPRESPPDDHLENVVVATSRELNTVARVELPVW